MGTNLSYKEATRVVDCFANMKCVHLANMGHPRLNVEQLFIIYVHGVSTFRLIFLLFFLGLAPFSYRKKKLYVIITSK
jgi:hypothetical protein